MGRIERRAQSQKRQLTRGRICFSLYVIVIRGASGTGRALMSYQVTLTYVGGERVRRADIYEEPTPIIGDRIIVNIGLGTTLAEVTSVRKHPIRSPGGFGEGVNDIDAQEISISSTSIVTLTPNGKT
jgi:hypothetical protein